MSFVHSLIDGVIAVAFLQFFFIYSRQQAFGICDLPRFQLVYILGFDLSHRIF